MLEGDSDQRISRKTNSSDDLPEYAVPIEIRTNRMQRLACGLHPHEVLLLSYASAFRCDGQTATPNVWKYSYGVADVNPLLISLKERNYIEIGGSLSGAQCLPVRDIKIILRKHGLSTSGNKEILLQRLADQLATDQLNIEFPNRYYTLTKKGMSAIAEEPQILYIHQHHLYGLNIWNLTELVHTEPYMNYRDKIWGYLNDSSIRHVVHRDFTHYRNTRLSMSDFVAEEGRYELAISFLCEVIRYDLSWLRNGYQREDEPYAARDFYSHKVGRIAITIIRNITKYQGILGWSDSDLQDKMYACYRRVKLPINVFTDDECIQLFFAERIGLTHRIVQIYTTAEQRYFQKK